MLLYVQMIDEPKDQSKFEKIYMAYRDRMYHVAYSILRNEQDAEDAVHQAFIKIVENISKISEPVCPKTAAFVVTIVERKAIDLYRRKRRRSTVSLEEAQGIAVHYDGDNALAGCIASLPCRYRQVLLLRYAHGYSVQEIAKMLDMRTANVYKLEQRAREKLEILCKEAGIL